MELALTDNQELQSLRRHHRCQSQSCNTWKIIVYFQGNAILFIGICYQNIICCFALLPGLVVSSLLTLPTIVLVVAKHVIPEHDYIFKSFSFANILLFDALS